MTKSDYKAILRSVRRSTPDKARALYMEVYGAEAGSTLTVERIRASITEACQEMLDRGKPAPEPRRLTPSEIRRRHVERALKRCPDDASTRATTAATRSRSREPAKRVGT